MTHLRQYVEHASAEIDRHPGAWCAVESALLDLFAREEARTIEDLLGVPEDTKVFSYSAVVGVESGPALSAMIQKYLAAGFRDFKLKLSGEPEADRAKLETFSAQCEGKSSDRFRLRLDANNVWGSAAAAAKSQLKQLGGGFDAVEEPLSPRLAAELNELGTELGVAIILDESLCRKEDLALYESLPARWIGNVKVSKLGGILRSLDLIEALRDRGWPIVIGAQVGETSVLTRLGIVAARAAGQALWAHEGAFGTHLLERDPVTPVLQFGPEGRLDLSQQGLQSGGLGLKKHTAAPSERSGTG